jgi:hypothetical protein
MQLLTQKQKGSRPYPAAYKEEAAISIAVFLLTSLLMDFSSTTFFPKKFSHSFPLPLRQGERIPQRVYDVHHLTGLTATYLTGTIPHLLDKQPQLVLLSIHEVDGDRPAQEGAG